MHSYQCPFLGMPRVVAASRRSLHCVLHGIKRTASVQASESGLLAGGRRGVTAPCEQASEKAMVDLATPSLRDRGCSRLSLLF